MTKITICDVTLKEYCSAAYQVSFKEKVEVAKLLDKMGADVIECGKLVNKKTDTLFLHTIIPLVKNSVICCSVELDESSVESTYEALKSAPRSRLLVSAPLSPMQMEFVCHCKEKALLEKIKTTVSKAASLCSDVEFVAEDATRSEKDVLARAINTAIEAGATTVTLCDSAGIMLPEEFASFIREIKAAIPALEGVTLSVECSNSLSMGEAVVISTLAEGVSQIKTGIECKSVPSTQAISNIFRTKGSFLGYSCSLNNTLLSQAVSGVQSILSKKSSSRTDMAGELPEDFTLNKEDDIKTVSQYIARLGYELSEEDTVKVYESFRQLAQKKPIGPKELDAIIASNALQVTPTYTLKSYVINTGNVISSTAAIELEKAGSVISGISLGDGPIDAAFLAIEQIIGHHYELDDFQIQSVTEGREAVGEAIVKLRSEGKLYSGRGISTDIVGASIKAYINAINKICFEE